MKNPILLPALLLLLLCAPLSAIGQSPVKGRISAPDTAKLSVIRVTPDSFPRVTIVFKAETKNKQPVWNLGKDDINVTEDDKPCTVVSLKKISKTRPVKVMLVVDHSGSMASDARLQKWYASLNWDTIPYDSVQQKTTTKYTDSEGNISDSIIAGVWTRVYQPVDTPAWWKPPFYYARKGVNAFISSVNTLKDSFGIVGFDDAIDYKLSLTNNPARAHHLMNTMNPDGGTAFYDALMAALQQFRNEPDRQLCAVIAMTDGQDNSSHVAMNHVIKEAKKLSIPVFVIGLGDVNKKVLRRIAEKTDGDAYFTNDAKKLGDIYLAISKRVQSVYELVYASPSVAATDTSRDVVLSFNVDSLYLDENHVAVQLPDEVMQHLQATAQTLPAQHALSPATPPADNNNSPFVAISIIVAAAGAGIVVARAVKKQQQSQNNFAIVKLYPDPTNGPLTVETINATPASGLKIFITDAKGQLVFTTASAAQTGNISIDIGHLSPGTYSITAQNGTAVAPGKQFVVTS